MRMMAAATAFSRFVTTTIHPLKVWKSMLESSKKCCSDRCVT